MGLCQVTQWWRQSRDLTQHSWLLILWPISSVLVFWERGDLVVALTGTVSQVLAHSLPAMLMTGQAEEVVAWVSLPQCQQPQLRCHGGKGSSVPARWVDSGIPILGLRRGAFFLVPGVRGGFGGEGERSDSWEKRRQEELQGGRPGKGLRQHLSASVCHGPAPWSLGSSQSRSRGNGRIAGAWVSCPSLSCQGQTGWAGDLS